MIGMPVKYKDHDGKTIDGKITFLALQNKTKSITWVNVDFGHKAFIVPFEELIIMHRQLELF